jgi:hypothetical protein
MKKHSLSLLLTFLSVSVLAQWNFVGPAGISGGSSAYNKIAIGASGNPVTVFLEGYPGKIRCFRYNGTQWDAVDSLSIDSFPIGEILDFKSDRNNQYYIAFRNSLNNKISCIRFNGSEWKYVGSQYISEDINQQISMAVDTAGIVYMVYIIESGAQIVKENAGNWTPVTTNGIDRGIIYPDLKFDAGNVGYLGYCAASTIRCDKLINDTWVPVGNTIESLTIYPLYTKLNITKNQDLYIVFDTQLINCFKLNDQTNAWENLGGAGLGGDYSWSGDLTSDSQGNVYISNEPVLSGDRARCFSFDGEGWVQLGDSGISKSYTGFVRIAANNYGNLFAAYNDGTIGKAVVKEFTFPTGIKPVSFDKTVRMYPNPVNGILVVELPGQQFSVSIVDIKGNMVYRNTPASDKIEIHTESFARGVYLVRLTSGKATYSCRKLIVM